MYIYEILFEYVCMRLYHNVYNYVSACVFDYVCASVYACIYIYVCVPIYLCVCGRDLESFELATRIVSARNIFALLR